MKWNNMKWYEVIGYRGHVGRDKSKETVFYVYAENIEGVLKKYRRMPGIKKGIKYSFPSIRELSEEEAKDLERRIFDDTGITVRRAKQTWYYPQNELY